MRAVRSILHPDDLARLVEREYELAAPVTVSLFRVGFNDTHAVTDARGGRWILRVYLREKYWIRSDSDLRCELELLDHLAAAGRPVARPRRRRDGDLLGRLQAPEGERCFALFPFAGRSARGQTLDLDFRHALGGEVARLHRAMDEFRSEHDRYHLDAALLVDMPLAMIDPIAGPGQRSAVTELRRLCDRLKEHLSTLELERPSYGLIHADIHTGNILLAETGSFVLVDFDHCGFGWRAYDLVNFYEGPDSAEDRRREWATLLAGYESVRPLGPRERDALPVLAACRELWDVGDGMRAASWGGVGWDPASLCQRVLDDVRRPLAGLAPQRTAVR